MAPASSPVSMTGLKLAMAANLKTTLALVWLDGAIQPRAWNALFHRASVARELRTVCHSAKTLLTAFSAIPLFLGCGW